MSNRIGRRFTSGMAKRGKQQTDCAAGNRQQAHHALGPAHLGPPARTSGKLAVALGGSYCEPTAISSCYFPSVPREGTSRLSRHHRQMSIDSWIIHSRPTQALISLKLL